eukprot:1150935-Pelagomonas_calceolata.AAC.5
MVEVDTNPQSGALGIGRCYFLGPGQPKVALILILGAPGWTWVAKAVNKTESGQAVGNYASDLGLQKSKVVQNCSKIEPSKLAEVVVFRRPPGACTVTIGPNLCFWGDDFQRARQLEQLKKENRLGK